MRQIACVHLIHWPIERWQRRAGWRNAQAPLALVTTAAGRQAVAVASASAQKSGVRAGLSLAEARVLCPALRHGEYEPQKDRRALEALGRWMMRFSPVVSLDPGSPAAAGRRRVLARSLARHADRAQAELRPAIFLDVTGCQRLFGGMANLLEQLREAVGGLRLSAAAAIAPTPGAAWALAWAGRDGAIVDASQLAAALAPLPVESLRLGEEILEALFHLGVRTIGQLMQLGRSSLPGRFGNELLLRLDQALGHAPEPLAPLQNHRPIRAGIEFPGMVDSLEAIWETFRMLIEQVVGELARRGQGARLLRLEFLRASGGGVERTIELSRPSRDRVSLFNLMRCAAERLLEEHAAPRRGPARSRGRFTLSREGNNEPAGFSGIVLEAARWQPLEEEQALLMGGEEREADAELRRLIDRLVLRLGGEAVSRARVVESHLPEKAWEALPAASAQVEESSMLSGERCRRPLWLLDTPEEIAVVVSPSDDRDGRPICIREGTRVRRVIHAIGPERIAGQWWQRHGRTRDYFEVEDETGRRTWLFRVRETSKWYRHGEFG